MTKAGRPLKWRLPAFCVFPSVAAVAALFGVIDLGYALPFEIEFSFIFACSIVFLRSQWTIQPGTALEAVPGIISIQKE